LELPRPAALLLYPNLLVLFASVAMSAFQERTSRVHLATSALPPKADIRSAR